MNTKPKKPSELLPNATKKGEPAKPEMKKFIVECGEDLKVEISFPKSKQGQYDCIWLFGQAIRLLADEAESKSISLDLTNVVALKTKSNSFMLDYWLTLPDKSLTPIPDGTILVPYIGESSPKDPINNGIDASSVTVQDFDILHRIGKGGYARVFLGKAKYSSFKADLLCFCSKKKAVRQVLRIKNHSKKGRRGGG